MKYFYFDESIHERGGFIIGAFISSDKDLDNEIVDTLKDNGFNPEVDEYKSSLNVSDYPTMPNIRSKLRRIVSENCKIGIVILPIEERGALGQEAIKGLSSFIDKNSITEEVELYMDEGIFSNKDLALDKAKNVIGLDRCKFYFEQNSKVIKGIQLADLVAHTASTMLLNEMGLISKKVDGKKFGFDGEVELNYELWGSLRYCFFNRSKENIDIENDDPVDYSTVYVEPYGLYISELCNTKLTKVSRSTFGEMYLGCTH